MHPLRIRRESDGRTEETGAVPIFSGTIVDLSDVISQEGTVLDSEICGGGGWIDLPIECLDWAGRKISRIYVPAFEHRQIGRFVQLHPMAPVANRVLHDISDYQAGLKTDTMLQGAVNLYFYTAMRLVGGKLGLLNTNILGTRVKESGRGVLLINADYNPRYVGLPKLIMSALSLKHDSLVILGRDPTIWHGSLEVVRARTASGNAIEVHPLLFKQLAGDCDGDEVYVYKVPETEECQEEARKQILKFTHAHAEWPAFMRETQDDTKVDWHRIRQDTKNRCEVTGFSVSPEEILGQSGNVLALDKRTGKDVAEECKRIAEGLSKADVLQYVEDQNVAMLVMKTGLGRVGAASNRLKTIAGTNEQLMESACYVSECLQQVLLDSKHHIGTPEEGIYSAEDLDAILNRQDQYEHTDLEDVLGILEKVGVQRDRAFPIIAYIWVVYPTAIAMQLLGQGLPVGRMKRIMVYTMHFLGHKDRALMLKKVALAAKVPQSAVEAKISSMRIGLSDICRAHYPIFEFAQDSCMANAERRVTVARRLFLDEDWDPTGVTRKSLDIAMSQIKRQEEANADGEEDR